MYLEKINLGISSKNIINAAAYFLLSTVITGWFIEKGNVLYDNANMMLFSGSIAGAKWGIQILAALIFLEDKKGQKATFPKLDELKNYSLTEFNNGFAKVTLEDGSNLFLDRFGNILKPSDLLILRSQFFK